ncbi:MULTISPECIES: hypothetical protein [Desulfovibrio]|uniref:Uncharacterized protein n=2 Tax=Desulfovibrio TaxID=872 RepID=A0AA94L2R9_DESDE|nr:MULTISPECIES: hypothetical protein [Desulfovibrio]ATD82364.1 hypothetical protein CNY67_13985 [Desulfovibrio sp. G11]SFW59112.1 hypothetical protein SAMN02910291_01997 [Desulfovibrio desulfuricans]SPD35143.1 Hypothetical protein DSVG11_1038 [Desulfovibrio sp. G11]
MREPNLKYFSKEEEKSVRQRAMALYDQGCDEEGDSLLDSLPMPAEYLQTLKECMGLDALIEEGVNLSKAVEKYGQNWLAS